MEALKITKKSQNLTFENGVAMAMNDILDTKFFQNLVLQ